DQRRGRIPMSARTWLSPRWQLFLMRIRTFTREPSATFWVFGFPLLISVALGLAFRNQGAGRLTVAVAEGPGQPALMATLGSTEGLAPQALQLDEAREALRPATLPLVP